MYQSYTPGVPAGTRASSSPGQQAGTKQSVHVGLYVCSNSQAIVFCALCTADAGQRDTAAQVPSRGLHDIDEEASPTIGSVCLSISIRSSLFSFFSCGDPRSERTQSLDSPATTVTASSSTSIVSEQRGLGKLSNDRNMTCTGECSRSPQRMLSQKYALLVGVMCAAALSVRTLAVVHHSFAA